MPIGYGLTNTMKPASGKGNLKQAVTLVIQICIFVLAKIELNLTKISNRTNL
ncbi:hypothetical protein N483_08300 [Pseudoalteromonas luteoviolacea NCIMB 1944]|nr:hypothetical protein N483_08300 [Pseudoalteromonas luteoviolacea NCIMB 1944]